MLTQLGYGGRLAHGPQPRPRRRPGLQCALGPLNRFGFARRMAATIAARISNTIRIGGTLVRRSLLLHEFREPIEVL